MITRILKSSFARPGLALTLVLAGTALGAVWLRELPRDVFPDLSAPVFNVIVQNPAMGAEELETRIAIPFETALAGLAGRAARPLDLAARRDPGHGRVRARRRLLPLAPVRRRARRAGRDCRPAPSRRCCRA